jgi:hypothetical protein
MMMKSYRLHASMACVGSVVGINDVQEVAPKWAMAEFVLQQLVLPPTFCLGSDWYYETKKKNPCQQQSQLGLIQVPFKYLRCQAYNDVQQVKS